MSDLPTYVPADEIAFVLGKMTSADVPKFRAASTADQIAALAIASARIDSMKFQGEPVEYDQPLAFPRRDPLTGRKFEVDDSGSGYVIPIRVQLATMHEAEMILDKDREGRLQKLADGLASQSVGSLSESYREMSPKGAAVPLCRDAQILLETYKLKTGGIL